MNRFLCALIVTLSFSILTLVGCGEGKEQAQSQENVTAENVKEDAAETMETAQAYTQQQKEEYQRELDEQLNALDQKLDKLEAKAESMQEDAKVRYENMLVTLKQKQRDAVDALDELKRESGEAWSTMKEKMDAMMKNLKNAFDQTEAQS